VKKIFRKHSDIYIVTLRFILTFRPALGCYAGYLEIWLIKFVTMTLRCLKVNPVIDCVINFSRREI